MSENIISVEAIINETMVILERHRNKIKDVFYEYKHDVDLSFSFWFDFSEPAKDLELELNKIQYLEIATHNPNHLTDATGHSVEITLPNLNAKELFIDALHNAKWCAMGC